MPKVINPANAFHGREIIIEKETEHDVLAWVTGTLDRLYLFAKEDIDVYKEDGE